MKMSKLHKIISVSFILLMVISLCFLSPTYAEEGEESQAAPEACRNAIEQNIQERYNLVLEKLSAQQYKIYMNGDPEDLDSAEFKIKGAGEYSYGDTTVIGGTVIAVDTLPNITKNNAVTFNAIPYSDGEEELLVVKVELVNGTTNFVTDCIFTENLIVKDYGDDHIGNIYEQDADNEHSTDKVGSICYNFFEGIWNESQFVGIRKADFDNYNYKAVAGQFIGDKSVQSIYSDILNYCLKPKVSSSAKITQERIANMIGNAITYAKSRLRESVGSQTFAELLETAKLNGEDKSGKEPKASLKCDWQKTDTSEDYYVNKDYFYKTEVEPPEKATYTYHYAPGNTGTKTVNVCQRTCSEAVKLEYGPPVASKAGLCFEYKVKVTSYVECHAEIEEEPPVKPTSYCSPAPFCHEKNWRWEGEQAGPNEEFDSCILDCDGGKYTSKCSKDCYKKVYKNSKIKLALDYENVLAEKMSYLSDELDACIAESEDGGCYYWSGSSIYWKSIHQGDQEYSSNPMALGRWYRNKGKDNLSINGKRYVVSTNGIKTRSYGNDSYCQDICYWKTSTCGTGQYLNAHSINTDYEANLDAYYTAITKCEAAATCTNTTAEFVISVDYNSEEEGGRVTEQSVIFPYSTGKDNMSSKGSGSANLNTASSLSDTSILSYDGCYKESEEKNWYMTEWSFPGTYIHNKTGEISFGVPSDPSGWYYENRKFCVPLNAASTHTKWWEWYVIAKQDFSNFCYTATDITNELNSEGYNIHATATNFGYYGWNFTVDCFYAARNEECIVNEPNKCCGPTTTKKTGINYTVRSIDRKNPFPNAPIEGVIDDTKRNIGFNWTSKARISELKNSSYSVDPEKLIQDIKSKADTLYNDDANLDYQFYLTPSTLNEIRKYNKKYDYGVWNGKTEKKNGIYVYLSNLWNSADHDVESTVDLRGISGAVLKTGTPGENNED